MPWGIDFAEVCRCDHDVHTPHYKTVQRDAKTPETAEPKITIMKCLESSSKSSNTWLIAQVGWSGGQHLHDNWSLSTSTLGTPTASLSFSFFEVPLPLTSLTRRDVECRLSMRTCWYWRYSCYVLCHEATKYRNDVKCKAHSWISQADSKKQNTPAQNLELKTKAFGHLIYIYMKLNRDANRTKTNQIDRHRQQRNPERHLYKTANMSKKQHILIWELQKI